MTHTDLIARLRRLSPSLDILSCEDVLQAADALTAAQERIEGLEGAAFPVGNPDLNLAAWMDVRRSQIGPWADYLIREVGKLESEIAHMRDHHPAPKTVQEAARVLLDQPYDVMRKAFDAMDRNQGEGADNIMAAALRALAAKGGRGE